jgi:hypothetical protein
MKTKYSPVSIPGYFWIAFNLTLMISCGKDNLDYPQTIIDHTVEPVIITYDTIIHPQLLNNYLFNKGTYWVYQDSATNQQYTCTVDSTVYEYYYTYDTNSMLVTRYRYNQISLNLFSTYLLCGNSLYFYPGNRIATIQDNGEFYGSPTISFYPVYTIDTTTYFYVNKIFYKKGTDMIPGPDCPDSGYYYLKAGIGVIKSEAYKQGQKTVYELKEFHIN